MKQPPHGTEERIARMSFAKVYPMYVSKVEKKGRTEAELQKVIAWLTGYDAETLVSLVEEGVDFQTFFDRCELNPNVNRITGVICGYRVEELEDSLHKKTRYLDKLVDELARGKKLESILRSAD